MVEFSWGYTKERKRKSAIFDSGENASGREYIREKIRTTCIYIQKVLSIGNYVVYDYPFQCLF